MNIEITELHKNEFYDYKYSKLILQIKGSGVNASVINCLRRVAYKNIPTYAICSQSIDIELNDSIYNNDYMRLRLEQFPLFNISSPIDFLPQKYWHNVDYSDIKRNKLPDDKNNLELYINVNNDTSQNMDVMSDVIKYYNNGLVVNDKLSKIKPILLIQLRPNQYFKARARAVLGVGERNDIWSAVSNFYYEETDKNSYKVTIESQGQMDEYEILLKGCRIIKKKLMDIKHLVNEQFKINQIQKGKLIEIYLTNEDHTIGNIINDGLQNNPKIIYSGLTKPDLLIKEIIIKLVSNSDPPLKPFFDVIEEKVDMFDVIESYVMKIGKKYIKHN